MTAFRPNDLNFSRAYSATLRRARTPGHVGLGGHGLHVLAQTGRVGHGTKLLFERALGREPLGREAAEGRRLA